MLATWTCSLNSTCFAFPLDLVGREVDATDPFSPEILRDRRRVAGGDGRDPDAVEVVGEERREAALRLCWVGVWSVSSRD
jgi:hypothetical protein